MTRLAPRASAQQGELQAHGGAGIGWPEPASGEWGGAGGVPVAATANAKNGGSRRAVGEVGGVEVVLLLRGIRPR